MLACNEILFPEHCDEAARQAPSSLYSDAPAARQHLAWRPARGSRTPDDDSTLIDRSSRPVRRRFFCEQHADAALPSALVGGRASGKLRDRGRHGAGSELCLLRRRAWQAEDDEPAHPGRGAANRSQYREAARAANRGKAMNAEQAGAHFEISIDGKPRTYRDTKEEAEQAAGVFKQQHPNSDVVVRDVRRANDPIPLRPPGAPPGSRGSST
jgi:hypothetical protein